MRNEKLKNPFLSRCVTSVPYFFPPGTQENMLSLLAERFEQNGRVGQIIGPHGTGKSTLLEALSQQLKGPVIKIVLRDRQRRLPPDFTGDHDKNCVVIIDGYEQFSVYSRLWLWWKRRQFGFGFLITAHRPIFGWPVLYETAPNRETYKRILQTLLKNEVEMDSQMLDSLFTKHQGNLREIFLELYDQWEENSSRKDATLL